MEKKLFLDQLKYLIKDEKNKIANLSNISALLNDFMDDLNWVGFYLNDGGELVLGPFQGHVACIRIPFNKGVCGKAARTLEVQRIEDVHLFEGHIACDGASNSEIVLPILLDHQLYAVLDIDSPTIKRFTQEDEDFLKDVVAVIENYL